MLRQSDLLRSCLFLVFQAIFRGSVPLQLSNWDRQHPQQPEPQGASQPGETDVTATAQWLTQCIKQSWITSAAQFSFCIFWTCDFSNEIRPFLLLCVPDHMPTSDLCFFYIYLNELVTKTTVQQLEAGQCNHWTALMADEQIHWRRKALIVLLKGIFHWSTEE